MTTTTYTHAPRTCKVELRDGTLQEALVVQCHDCGEDTFEPTLIWCETDKMWGDPHCCESSHKNEVMFYCHFCVNDRLHKFGKVHPDVTVTLIRGVVVGRTHHTEVTCS